MLFEQLAEGCGADPLKPAQYQSGSKLAHIFPLQKIFTIIWQHSDFLRLRQAPSQGSAKS